MNVNGYVPFLILLYTLPMNINKYCPISHKYVGYYCEGVKIYLVVFFTVLGKYCILLIL